MKKSQTPVPTEFEEQCAFVQYLELKGLKFTSIPNSTWTSSMAQKRKNSMSGLRPGFPDMVVCVPDRGLVCIEMKRTKNSVVSPEQHSWRLALNALPGIVSYICYGSGEAIDIMEAIIAGQVPPL